MTFLQHVRELWIYSILDMRVVDMRYVESHIYCSCYIVPVILFPFSGILFPLYCSMLSTELRSSYRVTCIRYCIHSCYIVYLIYQDISDHKVNWGMGETWRLIRSYRVMYWIHIVLPLQGIVVLPTDCIAPWAIVLDYCSPLSGGLWS